MADAADRWLLLPAPLRRLPADLAVVLALVLLTLGAVFLPGVRDTPLRVVVGLPFVLFLPGYALVAALFPEAGGAAAAEETVADEETAAGRDRLRDRGIDGVERVALSFGLSIAVVPLLGLVLNFTPWGIRLVPIVTTIGGVTVACVAVAARQRWALPESERLAVPYRAWIAGTRSALLEPESRTDAALNALLVVSIFLAVASVGYAVAVPQQGEQFTEFYLLTENETGDLVADGYPTDLAVGESAPVVVGVGNQEGEEVPYTVVVELQRTDLTERGNETPVTAHETTVTVREEEELARLGTRLGHNETWHESYEVEPTMTGENMRLAFLLYRGDAPADPTVENAYRELHLWVNVSEAPQGALHDAGPMAAGDDATTRRLTGTDAPGPGTATRRAGTPSTARP